MKESTGCGERVRLTACRSQKKPQARQLVAEAHSMVRFWVRLWRVDSGGRTLVLQEEDQPDWGPSKSNSGE